MTPCFGDTSYFLALLIPADANHGAARAWAARSRRPILTTGFIVLEVGNFLSPRTIRALFAGFVKPLRSEARMTVIPASSEILRRGERLYVSRQDKSWSVTDCISFEVMRERGITEALAADRHFEQAGFKAFLRV